MKMVIVRILQAIALILILVGFGFPGCISRPGLYVNFVPVLAGALVSVAARVVENREES